MPAPLRAGPYLVLGRALSRSGQSESAALTLLRVPILYRQHYLLAADGLLAAGRELENLQRHDQALGLYAELVREYPATDAAAEARQRLETPRVPAG
jgi:TolA-binding protein